MGGERSGLRIALVDPPVKEPRRPALALGYIAAALRGDGHQVSIHDVNGRLHRDATDAERDQWEQFSHWFVERSEHGDSFLDAHGGDLDRMLAAIAAESPHLVGFTVLLSQKPLALLLARRLRAMLPHARIVFGGPECFPQFIRQGFRGIEGPDYLVVGEGDETIREFARRLEAGEDPLCPGVVFCGDGAWVDAGPRPLIRNLDDLPNPSWEGFELDLYREKGRFSIFGSRGCVNNCSFCMEHEMWPRFRFRSPAHVLGEIEYVMAKFGSKSVEFVDSVVNGVPKKLMELADTIVERRIGIEWGAQATVNDALTRDGCRRLRAAGCGCLTFGMETGSDKVLELMGKRFRTAEASEVLGNCKAEGIATSVNIMVGFPGETEGDFASTLDFLERNRECITWVNPADAFTGIIPGTRLDREHEKFGVRFVGDARYWETTDGSNTFLVRLDRFERLLRHLAAIGLTCWYPGLEYKNRDEWIASYRRNKQKFGN